MTPIIMTVIMWGILGTTNPNVNFFGVIDEFPKKEDCMEIAPKVAVAIFNDLKEKQITEFNSITVVCIPAPAGKDTQQPNGKAKKHLRTEPIG